MIKRALSDGKQIRFWDDRWIGNLPLKDKLPRLYSISLCKESVINDVGMGDYL